MTHEMKYGLLGMFLGFCTGVIWTLIFFDILAAVNP